MSPTAGGVEEYVCWVAVFEKEGLLRGLFVCCEVRRSGRGFRPIGRLTYPVVRCLVVGFSLRDLGLTTPHARRTSLLLHVCSMYSC